LRALIEYKLKNMKTSKKQDPPKKAAARKREAVPEKIKRLPFSSGDIVKYNESVERGRRILMKYDTPGMSKDGKLTPEGEARNKSVAEEYYGHSVGPFGGHHPFNTRENKAPRHPPMEKRPVTTPKAGGVAYTKKGNIKKKK